MKSVLILILLFSGSSFMACSDDDGDGMAELALRAEFTTSLTPTSETGNCNEPFVFYNNQEGGGSVEGFGTFTTKINFCVNPNTFEYVDGVGAFFMANGDELYFTVAGQVLPSSDPDFDFEFNDPFIITGGTGRFEGATGNGTTASKVKFLENGDQTQHVWEGTLILRN